MFFKLLNKSLPWGMVFGFLGLILAVFMEMSYQEIAYIFFLTLSVITGFAMCVYHVQSMIKDFREDTKEAEWKEFDFSNESG